MAGFSDKVNNHYFRTFGSAALVALIGTGIDMAVPESSTLATDTASDAARRNFAETFGRVAEQTISKNLNVQPTIQIRPGYKFNVLVDQDIVFRKLWRLRHTLPQPPFGQFLDQADMRTVSLSAFLCGRYPA